jgi:rubrerythrin
LPLSKIRELFEELWEADKEHLKWFDPNHTGPLPETCAP